MIDDKLLGCVKKFSELAHRRDGFLDSAAAWRDDEKKAAANARDMEKEASDADHKIDELKLEMRTILNGEESGLPASLMIEAADNEIGRSD